MTTVRSVILSRTKSTSTCVVCGSVGATMTSDAQTYWKVAEATDTVLKAGTNVRAIGVDASGMYTQILFACDFLWVPTAAIGPNYESPWNGAPLPTGVIAVDK